jgi:hypothetical protein
MPTFEAVFVRGPKSLVEGLTSEDEAVSQGLKPEKRMIDAGNFDEAADMVLKVETDYNQRTKDATQEGVKYFHVQDPKGNRRSLI